MGRKKFTPNQFLKYVTEQVTMEEMDLWLRAHNISAEKSGLFFDFICSLYLLIQDTFLGEDAIVTLEDKKGHFTWCWEKNIDNFYQENIHFKMKGEHYEYFWNFYSESFYNNPKDKDVILKIQDFFGKLLILHLPKTKSELDIFGEIYIILNNNLIVNK